MKIRALVLSICFVAASILLRAADLQPRHENCAISLGEKAATFRLQMSEDDCHGRRDCGNNRSDMPMSRFTGISLAEFGNNGAHLTATLAAEAGTLTCTGTVSDSELSGSAVFTPAASFVARMQEMGFTGFDSDKLLAYALLNVESGWARSLQQAGIKDLNIDNLIALRVFNVDPAYVHSITDLGYPLPTADNLVAMSSQGVNAEEVREIRAMGYQPNFDQLIQIRIFKITPDFIHRMQARGFKNLTLDKLVQIRIFKLAD
jgi:hypothetical protein